MLKAISNPKKTTTKANIKVQIQKVVISIIVLINPNLNISFCVLELKLIKEL